MPEPIFPKILHVGQSDRVGGANRATYRLHQALCEAGAHSRFLAAHKSQDDPTVIPAVRGPAAKLGAQVADFLNSRVPFLYAGGRRGNFSPVRLAYGRLDAALLADTDLVVLHWIAGAFLKPSQLVRIGKPLVWQLWDLWPFTGGCHYPGECLNFEVACAKCPALGSGSRFDLAALDFAARRRGYRDLDLTIVAPSRWMGDKARRSALFAARRIEHIASGVDLEVFRPREKQLARDILGLPKDKKIILFGAFSAQSDRRKGYHLLPAALAQLANTGATDTGTAAAGATDIVLAVFGGSRHPPAARDAELPMPALHLGRFEDDVALALIYAAADVLVAPYLEDNLPFVILEALACGTPVVAFAAGGIPDAVDHQVNGYLAPNGDAAELGRGIAWVLDPQRHAALCRAARATAETRFDIRDCARRYRELAAELATPRRT
jgi:glycosyltransferase involved in cell wall biosynthesis